MTTPPLPPKRRKPAREARVWKAWAVIAKDDGAPLWFHWSELSTEFGGRTAAIYETREAARLDVSDGERVVRVEIREVPAPTRRAR